MGRVTVPPLQTYTTKIVIVEAFQYKGNKDPEAFKWKAWLLSHKVKVMVNAGPPEFLLLTTISGTEIVHAYDWMVRGVFGDFRSYKPEEFQLLFEKFGPTS